VPWDRTERLPSETPARIADSATLGETVLKIFVTGATGYIGGSVAERLVRDDHFVTGLACSAVAGRMHRSP